MTDAACAATGAGETSVPGGHGVPDMVSGDGLHGSDLWWFLPQKVAHYTTIPWIGARGASLGSDGGECGKRG